MSREPISTRLLSRRLVHRGASLSLLLGAACLAGFVRISFTPTSPPFRWNQLPVSYVIQSAGSADVNDPSDRTAVRLGFQAWEDLPASSASFLEDTTADAARTDFNAQDIHLVMWDEDGSSGLFAPGAGIIALTPLLASTSDGSILDADIVFNGALQFSTNQTAGTFDIQSVATHEVGHMLGFDHTGGPLVTMFAAIQAGQITARSPSRDDEAAAAHVYPAGATGRGRITGTIVRQGGAGVRFPQVVAVDVNTGELAGTALGTAGGNYALEGLLPGTYQLYAEALDGPFAPGDTIALQGQTIDTFDTTFFPGGTITLLGGQSLAATWSVTGTGALNASGGSGVDILAGSGRSLTISGTGLDQVVQAQVTGSGVTTTGLTFLSASGRLRVDLVAQAGANTGVRCLVLTDSSGRTAVLTGSVEVVLPSPVVTAVTPDVLASAGGELITLTGTGFAVGSQVVVGGQLATQVAVVSDTRIDCRTPPSPGAAGSLPVVVIRPDGREGRLNGAVTYQASPLPTKIDPALGPVLGGTVHTISGSGFVQGMTVTVGGNQATIQSLSGTQVKILLPPGVPGLAQVSCTFGNAEGLVPGGLTYVDATAPRIDSFTPSVGPTGGGTLVTIMGANFPPNAEVTFDGAAASGVNLVGTGQLGCVTPPHAAAAVEVRVRDPGSGLVGIAANSFSYQTGAAPSGGGGGGGGGGGCALSPAPGAASPPVGLLLVALLFVAGRRRAGSH